MYVYICIRHGSVKWILIRVTPSRDNDLESKPRSREISTNFKQISLDVKLFDFFEVNFSSLIFWWIFFFYETKTEVWNSGIQNIIRFR